MKLVAVHPAHLDDISGSSGYWVYADGDLRCYRTASAALEPRHTKLLTPREFQAKALALQDELAAWTDRNLRTADPTAWLLTPLHKNPFRSDFNLHAVWAVIVADSLRNQHSDIVVVTRSYGLVRTLATLCAAMGTEFRCAGHLRLVVGHNLGRLRSLGGLLRETARLLVSATLAKLVFGRRYKARLQSVEALIDTYVHENDISENGVFEGRYFRGVASFYTARGIRCAYYPILYRVPLARRLGIYRRMAACPVPFAPFEAFIRYSDIARAASVCLWNALLRRQPLTERALLGVDLTRLTESHAFRCAAEGVFPLVMVRAPARLSSAGVHPKWLLEWHENQSIDKANTIGFGAMAGCRTLAAKIYVPSRNILSLYTTTVEAERGVAPDENLVCGRALVGGAAIYDRRGVYRVAPALRYAHLYRRPATRTEKDLLILLTHSMEESSGILEHITRLLPDIVSRFERVRVRPHPDTVTSEIAFFNTVEFDNDAVVLDRRPLSELFHSTRLAVTAGSSAALEAVCAGIPVIIVGRAAGFDINPLEDVDRSMWQTVYDEDEMRRTIESWSPSHPLSLDERVAVGERIRNDYFEPVSEEAMEAFIPEYLAHREHRVSAYSGVHSENLHVGH